MMVVFYSGAIFSCRSFFEEQNDVGEDSWRYGFRGFVSNITNECTSWDNHDKWNEIWYDRLQTLLYMGIVGVMLAVLTLGLWVVHGTVRAPTIPTWIFASFFGIFGFLSFITLMGNCSNIPREYYFESNVASYYDRLREAASQQNVLAFCFFNCSPQPWWRALQLCSMVVTRNVCITCRHYRIDCRLRFELL